MGPHTPPRSPTNQPVAEPEDLDWADAVIMGSGTRYDGNPHGVGVGVVTGAGGVDDTANTALDHLVTRVLSVAGRLSDTPGSGDRGRTGPSCW